MAYKILSEESSHEGTWLIWPHKYGGMIHCITQQQPK